MKYRMKGDHSATCEAEFVTVGGYGFFAVVPKAYSESSIPIQFVKATLVPSGEFERVHEPVPEVGPIRGERERAVVVDEKCQVDTTDCCGMCRFWHQWDHLKATAEGVCRKSRPDHEGFPSVKRDSWCGEFETPLAPPVKPEEAGRLIEDEIQRRLDDETACESPLPDLLGRAAAEIRRLRKECEQLRSDLDESENDRACTHGHCADVEQQRDQLLAGRRKIADALEPGHDLMVPEIVEKITLLRKQNQKFYDWIKQLQDEVRHLQAQYTEVCARELDYAKKAEALEKQVAETKKLLHPEDQTWSSIVDAVRLTVKKLRIRDEALKASEKDRESLSIRLAAALRVNNEVLADLRESSATKAAILLALIDEVERLQRQLPPYNPPLTKTTITYRGYAVWIDAGEEMANLFAENVLRWSKYAFGERMNSDVFGPPIQPREDPPVVETSKKD